MKSPGVCWFSCRFCRDEEGARTDWGCRTQNPRARAGMQQAAVSRGVMVGCSVRTRGVVLSSACRAAGPETRPATALR